MNSKNAFTFLRLTVMAVAMSLGPTISALAHDDSTTSSENRVRVTPAALMQLDDARTASARYLDVDAAVADGYVDVGAFVPRMGWHYVNAGLIDDHFAPERPEILVYADDPCGGKRRLVAMEYAVPLALSSSAPAGFAGGADVWEPNTALGLWTLHAWIWEYNPAGVFASHNPRVP